MIKTIWYLTSYDGIQLTLTAVEWSLNGDLTANQGGIFGLSAENVPLGLG